MTKHDTLTFEEVKRYEINPVLDSFVDRYRGELNRPAAEIRILDWGCGRGRGVLKMRMKGYDCYGVDIDPEVLANATLPFEATGLPALSCLKPVQPDGRIGFENGCFDVVMSDQVLEHVGDPHLVIAEMTRVLAPGGAMIHCFPAHRSLVECHLNMPLVHWLPKNEIRRRAIGAFLRLGVDPGWQELSGSDNTARREAYYSYSVQRTFYRSPRTWRKLFEFHGLAPVIVSDWAPAVGRLKAALKPLGAESLINILMANFKMVYLTARRTESDLRVDSRGSTEKGMLS